MAYDRAGCELEFIRPRNPPCVIGSRLLSDAQAMRSVVFDALPDRVRPTLCPTVPSSLKPAFLGARPPFLTDSNLYDPGRCRHGGGSSPTLGLRLVCQVQSCARIVVLMGVPPLAGVSLHWTSLQWCMRPCPVPPLIPIVHQFMKRVIRLRL